MAPQVHPRMPGFGLLRLSLFAGALTGALGCRREAPAEPHDAALPDTALRPEPGEAGAPETGGQDAGADTAALDAAPDVLEDVVAEAAAPASSESLVLPMRKEDWEVAIGKWSFENGEATCECKATSSLLYWKHERPKDFDASVEAWFLTVESSAGILFRERGEDFYEDATFYQYEWYTRGTHHDKRLSLMIKNPYWVQIVTPKFPEAPLGRWIRLRVRAEGNHLQTWIDDDKVFDKVDNTFVRTGKIGLHVFQPRKIRLRNFRLTVLGESK